MSGRLEGKCLWGSFSEEEKELHDAVITSLVFFLFSFDSFPLSLGLILLCFWSFLHPIKPQELFLGLVELRSSITVWVPLLSLQRCSKESRKAKQMQTQSGERGIAATPLPSGAQDLHQLPGTTWDGRSSWADASSLIHTSPSSRGQQHPSAAAPVERMGFIPW